MTTPIVPYSIPKYLLPNPTTALLSESSPTRLSSETLSALNYILDELLLHIVYIAIRPSGSLQPGQIIPTERIRAAAVKVLGPVLGKRAVLDAELAIRLAIDMYPVVLGGDPALVAPQSAPANNATLAPPSHATKSSNRELTDNVFRALRTFVQTLSGLGAASPPTGPVSTAVHVSLTDPSHPGPEPRSGHVNFAVALYTERCLNVVGEHMLKTVLSASTPHDVISTADAYAGLSADPLVWPSIKGMRARAHLERPSGALQGAPESVTRGSTVSGTSTTSSRPLSASRSGSIGSAPVMLANGSAQPQRASPSRAHFPSLPRPHTTERRRPSLTSDKRRPSTASAASSLSRSSSVKETHLSNGFDQLMQSTATVKVSLTPDRLRGEDKEVPNKINNGPPVSYNTTRLRPRSARAMSAPPDTDSEMSTTTTTEDEAEEGVKDKKPKKESLIDVLRAAPPWEVGGGAEGFGGGYSGTNGPLLVQEGHQGPTGSTVSHSTSNMTLRTSEGHVQHHATLSSASVLSHSTLLTSQSPSQSTLATTMNVGGGGLRTNASQSNALSKRLGMETNATAGAPPKLQPKDERRGLRQSSALSRELADFLASTTPPEESLSTQEEESEVTTPLARSGSDSFFKRPRTPATAFRSFVDRVRLTSSSGSVGSGGRLSRNSSLRQSDATTEMGRNGFASQVSLVDKGVNSSPALSDRPRTAGGVTEFGVVEQPQAPPTVRARSESIVDPRGSVLPVKDAGGEEEEEEERLKGGNETENRTLTASPELVALPGHAQHVPPTHPLSRRRSSALRNENLSRDVILEEEEDEEEDEETIDDQVGGGVQGLGGAHPSVLAAAIALGSGMGSGIVVNHAQESQQDLLSNGSNNSNQSLHRALMANSSQNDLRAKLTSYKSQSHVDLAFSRNNREALESESKANGNREVNEEDATNTESSSKDTSYSGRETQDTTAVLEAKDAISGSSEHEGLLSSIKDRINVVSSVEECSLILRQILAELGSSETPQKPYLKENFEGRRKSYYYVPSGDEEVVVTGDDEAQIVEFYLG